MGNRYSKAVAEALKLVKPGFQVHACNAMYEKAKVVYEEKEAASYEFNQVSSSSGQEITDHEQAESICRKKMLDLRDETYKVTCLYVSKTVTRNLIDRTYTRAAYYVPIKRAAVPTATQGCISGVDRYTDLYVNVTIDGKEYVSFLDRPLYRKDDEFFHLRDDGFHDILVKGRILPKEDFFRKDGKLHPGVLVYLHPERSGYENLTAGQSKNFTVPCVAINHPKIDAHVLKYLLTYGACELLQQGDKEVSQGYLAQGNNRLSQNEAPNTPLGYVHTEAYNMGKYEAFGRKDYRDGFGLTSSRALGKSFQDVFRGRYVFAENILAGIGAQIRPHLNKVFSEVVEDDYIFTFISKRHKEEDIVYLLRSEITDEIQEAFRLAVESKGKEGPFAGKLIIISDTVEGFNHIDFLTDLNGLKAPFDLRTRTTWNILEMSHTPHDVRDGANLSGQLLQTGFMANWKRTFAFVRSSFRKVIERKKEQLTGEGRTLRAADLRDKPRWTDLLQAICPKLITHYYFPLLKQYAKSTLKGLVGMADRFGIPTEGCYTKVVTDPAADFEMKLLKVRKDGRVEILAPAFEGTEFNEVILTKYPKQHYREFTHCVVVSRQEYIQRVFASDLSDADKEVLVRKVAWMSGGLTAVPASKSLMDLHAGMDFDGDGVIAYANKILIKIITTNLKSLVVSINPDD